MIFPYCKFCDAAPASERCKDPGECAHTERSATQMKRRPHRVILPNGTLLKFWTASSAQIAANGSDYEREGKKIEALQMWGAALKGTPADEATIIYCASRILALTENPQEKAA